ncbi:MAG: methionine gamma-lyase family protein [Clostridia bacterium]|nr:methionine gamma-lyase family protein [Clostridia bacterium]
MGFFKIDERLQNCSQKALAKASESFLRIDDITEYNQQKVLAAFVKNGVAESHFAASTGYGYNDRGRDTLEQVFADCMGAEASIFRHSFASGTHTLNVMLFGVLRPGDTMLCLTGRPYDTLIGVLGIDSHVDGSLKDFGVNFEQVDLKSDGTPDMDAIEGKIKAKKYKVAYIQRSRGYSLRPSLSVSKIGEMAQLVKKLSPDTLVLVDNCYGEFVEKREPLEVGADLIAGSLIKNPGGGIAPTGGYIAGRADLVEKCGYRLTAPGVGLEVGATLGHTRELFMGLFNAPHVVGEAVKTAVFTAALFETLGFEVTPSSSEPRADIIQTVKCGHSEGLIAFCRGLQSGSPVDSFAAPEPGDMPGYDSQVIMAAGAFTLGASIELSADAPLREPFAVWMQGGLNFHSAKVGIMLAAQKMLDEGHIKL